MPDEACRLAKCEQNIENLSEKLEEHFQDEEKFMYSLKQDLERSQSELRNDIRALMEAQKNQQGFVRGVAFTVSALVGGVGIFFNWWYKS